MCVVTQTGAFGCVSSSGYLTTHYSRTKDGMVTKDPKNRLPYLRTLTWPVWLAGFLGVRLVIDVVGFFGCRCEHMRVIGHEGAARRQHRRDRNVPDCLQPFQHRAQASHQACRSQPRPATLPLPREHDPGPACPRRSHARSGANDTAWCCANWRNTSRSKISTAPSGNRLASIRSRVDLLRDPRLRPAPGRLPPLLAMPHYHTMVGYLEGGGWTATHPHPRQRRFFFHADRRNAASLPHPESNC